jgi:hypothetical protein
MINWSKEDLKSYLERTNNGESQFHPYKPKKKSKYNNKKITIDGHVFDSIKESEYYSELKLRLKAEDIFGFCIQPIFILSPSISYRPDFIVWNIDKSVEIIDTKGFKTDVYKMKKKLFEEKFNLTIKEIY